MIHDYCIIGGGIVGLATAHQLLLQSPGARIVVLEKEAGVALHQTGHNSGVIHAGIYYQPGSLKADLCRRGAAATKAFCTEHGIPFEVCGKLIVATDAAEAVRLEALAGRARQNQIEVERLGAAELREREPNIRGEGALLVKATGIVDYRRVSQKLCELIQQRGARVEFGAPVSSIRETAADVMVEGDGRSWTARRLIACAGLQSDRLARLAGLAVQHRIIPFRGEYYRLPAAKSGIIRSLIYPVPDPALPFLGVHLTRMIDGCVTVGPNAVLGFAREGYRRGSIRLGDVADFARFGGFWRMLWAHRRFAASEMSHSLWKSRYLEDCRKYCPGLVEADLLPYEAGIRAQAVMADGTLVHDFLFLESKRMLHVCNAPSPAATSALPIGEMIARRFLGR
jgi:L-2-hydroxyglutarate oxidase